MRLESQKELDWLQLMLCANEIGIDGLKRLTEVYGSIDEIVSAGRREVAEVIGKEASYALFSDEKQKDFENACRWLDETPGADVVTWSDADYPRELLTSSRSPAVLYLRGKRELLSRRRFYVTGTLRPDAEGRINAASFGEAIATREALVTGLESGVEECAVRAALKQRGAVIAVQATGPDRLYPKECRELFHELAQTALVVSPFPVRTGFEASHTAVRRTVSLFMSEALLVVQAEMGSDALALAREAAESGKDVFAIPGSIHSALYKGNHKLLREGAGLVESIRDLGIDEA